MSVRKCLLIGIIYYIIRIFQVPNPVPFKLSILDVGQGDSILIESYGSRALVDGGADFGADMLLSNYSWNTSCSFDILILSHFHADHIGVLENYAKRCNFSVATFNDIALSPTRTYPIKENIPINTLYKFSSWEKYFLGDVELIFIDVSNELSNSELANLNNSSLIVLVKYKDFEALLLGDSELTALSKIDISELKSHIKGDLEVLKISHHGSDTGLYKPLIEKLAPKNCVISVGTGNSFGHPHQSTLTYLESVGCRIMRTDELGTITFEY